MTETTQTHALIGKYYEEEREQREKELSLAELKLRLDANDLAMLGMIARRFRKGRDDVAQEVCDKTTKPYNVDKTARRHNEASEAGNTAPWQRGRAPAAPARTPG